METALWVPCFSACLVFGLHQNQNAAYLPRRNVPNWDWLTDAFEQNVVLEQNNWPTNVILRISNNFKVLCREGRDQRVRLPPTDAM